MEYTDPRLGDNNWATVDIFPGPAARGEIASYGGSASEPPGFTTLVFHGGRKNGGPNRKSAALLNLMRRSGRSPALPYPAHE